MPMGDEEKELKFVQLFWESHAQKGRERWKKDDNGWTNEAQPYIDNAKAGNKNPDSMVILGNTVTYGQLLSSYAKYENIIMPYFRSVGAPPSTDMGIAAADFEGYTFLGVHPSLISTNRSELDSYYAKLDWKSKTKLNPSLAHEQRWLGTNTRTSTETTRDKTRVVRFVNMPMMTRDGGNDPLRPDQRVRAGGSLKFSDALVDTMEEKQSKHRKIIGPPKATPALYQSYIARSKGRVVEIDFCQEAYRELTQAFINIREVYGDNMIVAIPSLCYIWCVHHGHGDNTGTGGSISAHWNYRAIDFDKTHNPDYAPGTNYSDIWNHETGCYKPAIEILEYYGFNWGLKWNSRKDTMHIDCG